MDALLMCGGRGTRLETGREKPLVRIGGEPMVDRVRAALQASRVETVHAVVSPAAPETAAHLADLPRIETPGEGYVADLGTALEAVDSPAVTVAADLPLLQASAIDRLLDRYEGAPADRDDASEDRSLTACVPVALKRRLGASVDATLAPDAPHLAPTGCNVVADAETNETHMSYDARLAINVNRPGDVRLAESMLAGGGRCE